MIDDDTMDTLWFVMTFVVLLAIGIAAGFWLNFWTFSLMVCVSILIGYIGPIDEDWVANAVIFGSIFIWLVGGIAWYFATNQHWVGDFVGEFVLR